MKEIKATTFKVLFVEDSEGAAELEQAFKDRYRIANVSAFDGGIVYVMTKGA